MYVGLYTMFIEVDIRCIVKHVKISCKSGLQDWWSLIVGTFVKKMPLPTLGNGQVASNSRLADHTLAFYFIQLFCRMFN